MPIYEYECQSWGERFEQRRGIDESDSEVKCPKCAAKHPQRVFSAFSKGDSSAGGCAPTAPT